MNKNWTPISIFELQELITAGVSKMTIEQLEIWNKISIPLAKWEESELGKEGQGFWVLAIDKDEVIWYNDIEEGFNISTFTSIGKIDAYGSEQDELQWTIHKLK